MNRALLAAFLEAGTLCLATAARAEEPVEPLDAIRVDIPVPHQRLLARTLSANGQAVGGDFLDMNGKARAFVWHRDGRTFLIDNPGTNNNIFVKGVSPDGSVVVGSRWVGSRQIAYRWTVEGGVEDLPSAPGATAAIAFCASDFGHAIAGRTTVNGQHRPWVWTQAAGVVELPAVQGSTGGAVYAMTPDASVLVGCSFGGSANLVPAAWFLKAGSQAPNAPASLSIGVLALQLPPTPDACTAKSVSADGSTIVGSTGSVNGAAIWRADGSGLFLGNPTNSPRMDHAIAVTADGKQIAGDFYKPGTSNISALWSQESGPVMVSDLKQTLGLDGQLGAIIGMSADGRTLLFSDTRNECWLLAGMPRIDAPPCAADFDISRLVDDRDFVTFAAAYTIGDCADTGMPTSCPADFNHDAFVTDADFQFFVAQYSEAICPR